MTTIVDKVKLVVVHRDSPDIETELGTYPFEGCRDAGLSRGNRQERYPSSGNRTG
jgi:hypothetical protein